MMTITEARFALDRQLLARHFAGQSATVEQLDACLCEDGLTALCYVYLAGEPDPLIVTFAAPLPFSAERVEEALTRQGTAH